VHGALFKATSKKAYKESKNDKKTHIKVIFPAPKPPIQRLPKAENRKPKNGKIIINKYTKLKPKRNPCFKFEIS
jgi:hypothetical protein